MERTGQARSQHFTRYWEIWSWRFPSPPVFLVLAVLSVSAPLSITHLSILNENGVLTTKVRSQGFVFSDAQELWQKRGQNV